MTIGHCMWTCVGVSLAGRVFIAASEEVENDRTIDDGWWKNIVNLPSLVVIEWQGDKDLNLNQFFIYVKS